MRALQLTNGCVISIKKRQAVLNFDSNISTI